MFVLQDDSLSTVGVNGEGMGFQGISPSFGIIFYTHQNQSDLTSYYIVQLSFNPCEMNYDLMKSDQIGFDGYKM